MWFRHLLLLCAALPLALGVAAQPTWRFHLAFEDGTGARDTIWMVYDQTATVGSDFNPQVDYALGEGGVTMDPTRFNVWTWNWDEDSTKTHAFPYSQFPNFDGTIIDAMNWVPPMTIRWDTSLFHAPYLPYEQGSFGQTSMGGDYFFFHSNDGTENGFDMQLDDSAYVDQDADHLFTIGIYFGPGNTIGITDDASRLSPFSVFPNPAQGTTHVSAWPDVPCTLSMYDVFGKDVMRTAFTTSTDLALGGISSGVYTYRLSGANGEHFSGRLVVGQ